MVPTFVCLSAGYLLASRKEVDSVELPYLNRARLAYTSTHFLDTGKRVQEWCLQEAIKLVDKAVPAASMGYGTSSVTWYALQCKSFYNTVPCHLHMFSESPFTATNMAQSACAWDQGASVHPLVLSCSLANGVCLCLQALCPLYMRPITMSLCCLGVATTRAV
eukprot:GHUV01047098.1.p1 GENE.GHUV01047098.1~~GHUV01047098.1.p1  ORF type:complete len:163 (+),score=19.72 GHUV01047098.1:196-684(+)